MNIEQAAEKMESLLQQAIEIKADYHGRTAKLNDDQIDRIKGLAWNIIKSMEVSILVNAKINNLPVAALFVTVIEAIEAWSQELDELSGKPKKPEWN